MRAATSHTRTPRCVHSGLLSTSDSHVRATTAEPAKPPSKTVGAPEEDDGIELGGAEVVEDCFSDIVSAAENEQRLEKAGVAATTGAGVPAAQLGLCARALHKWPADAADEVAFEAGELIVNVVKSYEPQATATAAAGGMAWEPSKGAPFA